MERISLKFGEILYKQGDKGPCFFVLDGKVHLESATRKATASAGEFAGLSSFARRPYFFTAFGGEGGAQVMSFKRDELLEFVRTGEEAEVKRVMDAMFAQLTELIEHTR
ncbi:MAG: hypothetical protein ACR2OR_05090 [Hyphomicrobiales bacterium]